MRRLAVSLAILVGLLAVIPFSALAGSPAGMRLYVFTSGSLGGFPKAALQIGGQGAVAWAPVGFFVIKHPKGNVLFDTGNNDKTIQDPAGWWGPLAKAFGLKMTKDDAIDVQLGKIGLKPSDIKYVILGHMHLDHGGNMCQFSTSTFLIQNDELKAAWWPDPGYSVYYIPGDFACSKNLNIVRLSGDSDIFNDRSIEVHRAIGHTPGSQFAVVRLPKTGTVVLTSDVVYLKENLEKNLIPPIPGTWSPMAMYRSYEKVRHVRDAEDATIIYAHDPDVFKAAKHAPDYYE